jgi:hypothetical protein
LIEHKINILRTRRAKSLTVREGGRLERTFRFRGEGKMGM